MAHGHHDPSLIRFLIAVFLMSIVAGVFAVMTEQASLLHSTFAVASPLSASRPAVTPKKTEQASAQTTPVKKKKDATVLVTRVIDGDTIELEDGQRVRYIGVNTPETVDPRKKVQCFGKEAKAHNRLLVEGVRVRLEKDVEDRDKYHRLLRYVWVGDTMINEQLVSDGYAQVMTIPPNVKYVDLFRVAQTQAREAKRGLWEKCKR